MNAFCNRTTFRLASCSIDPSASLLLSSLTRPIELKSALSGPERKAGLV